MFQLFSIDQVSWSALSCIDYERRSEDLGKITLRWKEETRVWKVYNSSLILGYIDIEMHAEARNPFSTTCFVPNYLVNSKLHWFHLTVTAHTLPFIKLKLAEAEAGAKTDSICSSQSFCITRGGRACCVSSPLLHACLVREG